MVMPLVSRLLLSIAAFCAFDNGAASACNPLERYLAIGPMPTFQTGSIVPLEGVYEVTLKPLGDVVYPSRSGDTPSANNGGLVTVADAPAGRYAILLSQKAQLQVFQLLPFAPIPIIIGSTEVDMGIATINANRGPLTLQFSDVATPSIIVTVLSMSNPRTTGSECK